MKGKFVDEFVNVTTVQDGIVALMNANNAQGKMIEKLAKANKRLAFAVFCLSIGGYLTYKLVDMNHKQIKQLQKQIDELKAQNDIPVGE